MEGVPKVMRKLVEVLWLDSAFHTGWKNSRVSVDISHCRTTGYLVERNKHRVVVAMHSEDGVDGSYGEAMAIPRACVKKIRRLR